MMTPWPTIIGSTVVYPYDNISLPAVELGASIFVEANRNLMRAAKEFNLSLFPFGEDSDEGFWDGNQFVLLV
jgi:prenylcysteine oxidase/farnesylcysteine lyase